MNTGQAQAPISKPTVMYFTNVRRRSTYGWYVVGRVWYADEKSMHSSLDPFCNLVSAPATAQPPVFSAFCEPDEEY